jgi:hypothetical protein
MRRRMTKFAFSSTDSPIIAIIVSSYACLNGPLGGVNVGPVPGNRSNTWHGYLGRINTIRTLSIEQHILDTNAEKQLS